MTQHVHLNGALVPAEQATISVADAGLLHGASTFTTMLARNGVVFRFDRHLKRLSETVAVLGLRADVTAQQLHERTYELLSANQLADARVRITLTPGSVRGDSPPTTLITAEPLSPSPPQWYEKGVAVIVSSFKQAVGDPTFGYKTGCYLPRILARQEAAAKGAEEALWFTPDNRLAEACFNNVFLVHEGKVFTPPRDTPVLPGIVREAVLEICPTLGIPADEQTPLTVREMLAAAEVFLTGSTSGIRPVVQIERHAVGDSTPGPITRKLMAAYDQMLNRECAQPPRGTE